MLGLQTKTGGMPPKSTLGVFQQVRRHDCHEAVEDRKGDEDPHLAPTCTEADAETACELVSDGVLAVAARCRGGILQVATGELNERTGPLGARLTCMYDHESALVRKTRSGPEGEEGEGKTHRRER